MDQPTPTDGWMIEDIAAVGFPEWAAAAQAEHGPILNLRIEDGRVTVKAAPSLLGLGGL